jgi:hypothetical protein
MVDVMVLETDLHLNPKHQEPPENDGVALMGTAGSPICHH